MTTTFLLLTDLMIFLGGAAIGGWAVWAYLMFGPDE